MFDDWPMAGLPADTVTLLFTNVEGSTKDLHKLGTESYAEALAERRGAVRQEAAALAYTPIDAATLTP